jgi:hypothetical protein
MDSTVLPVNVVLAGRVHDHGLLEVKDHADGASDATTPVGSPVTVKVTAVGKEVPLLGAMGNEYVAVLPGRIVSEEPVTGTLRMMSIADSETVLLGPAERKFVSPL